MLICELVAFNTSRIVIFYYSQYYRIGLDGKLTLEEKLKGIYVTGRKIEETRKKLLKAGKAVPIR